MSVKYLAKVVNFFHHIVEIIARRFFLLIAYLSGPVKSPPAITDHTLTLSATVLASKIRNRKLTSEEVVRSYINRIKEIQPSLNCVCENRFEAALEEAKACDELLNSDDCPSAEELAEKKPFLGVPFTTKDTIAIKNMKQTAGLVVRKDYRTPEDAEAIRLIREAGGIPIAKTNVSELAMWWESTNCLYGTTSNPYNTRHIVGGSSGGEGCIQAAAGSAFGIGSDIGGSVRMPSFFNGIFGHKPSQGIVSNHGQYPNADTKDQEDLLQIGPMCRFAEDLAPILQILANKNAHLLNLNSKVDLSKIKLYYMEDDGGEMLVSHVDSEIRDSMRKVVKYLENVHNIKAKKVTIRQFKKSLPLWFSRMSAEPDKDFLSKISDQSSQTSFMALFWLWIKWFTFSSDHTVVALFTAFFERFNMSHGSKIQIKLRNEGSELQKEFWSLLGNDAVFLYPTHPTAAPLHYEPFIKPLNFSYTAIFNVLAVPVTACPLGLNKQGLPIGIQVAAGPYQDRLTIAIAKELQRGFGGWVPPTIVLPD